MSAKRAEPPTYVLDTSALLAYFGREEGFAAVGDLLRQARRGRARVFVSLMTVYELLYVGLQEEGEEEALRRRARLLSLGVDETPLGEEVAARAARLKAAHRISVADSWIAATAIEAKAILVHKDPELVALGEAVRLETLPLK